MSYNYKQIDEVLSYREVKELLDHVASVNNSKYNMTKAAEEFNELALVCLQYANKIGANRPKDQEIIDEIGDSLMRIHVIMKQTGITEGQIKERILHKANKYLSYLKSEKYTNGI